MGRSKTIGALGIAAFASGYLAVRACGATDEGENPPVMDSVPTIEQMEEPPTSRARLTVNKKVLDAIASTNDSRNGSSGSGVGHGRPDKGKTHEAPSNSMPSVEGDDRFAPIVKKLEEAGIRVNHGQEGLSSVPFNSTIANIWGPMINIVSNFDVVVPISVVPSPDGFAFMLPGYNFRITGINENNFMNIFNTTVETLAEWNRKRSGTIYNPTQEEMNDFSEEISAFEGTVSQ